MNNTDIAKQAVDNVCQQRLEEMEAAGITFHYLIKKLKKELNADVTKTIKVKGAVTASELPKGFKCVVTSGQIITLKTKDGIEEDYGDGETIVAWNETDWGTRQKARMDAHKLRGDYAPDKHEHTGKGGGPILTKVVDMTDDELLSVASGSISRASQKAQSKE